MRRSKATHCGDDFGLPATVPTFSIFVGCCARAASGHTAVPPMSAMNSRRFSRSNCMRSPPAWAILHDIDFAEVSQRARQPLCKPESWLHCTSQVCNGSFPEITAAQHCCPLHLNEQIMRSL